MALAEVEVCCHGAVDNGVVAGYHVASGTDRASGRGVSQDTVIEMRDTEFGVWNIRATLGVRGV